MNNYIERKALIADLEKRLQRLLTDGQHEDFADGFEFAVDIIKQFPNATIKRRNNKEQKGE